MENTIRTLLLLWRTRLRMIGKLMPARMEESDTIRLTSNTAIKTKSEREQAIGRIQNTTPNMVATPLPPLKPANTGKMWPIKAAIPKPS